MDNKETEHNPCPLCSRELESPTTKHHLVPQLKGGRKLGTVLLHRICHDKIHSIFTERELQVSYNTIEKLLSNEEIQKFVKWVEKKEPSFYDSSKQNSRKKH